MFNLSLLDLLLLIDLFAFINWAVATVAFGRITMRYIDQKFKESDDASADWDKGWGMRIIFYSQAIISRKPQERSLVNESLVKQFARKKDVRLAWYYNISAIVFLSLMFFIYFYFDLEA